MDEEYDVIVLGTGLTVSVLFAILQYCHSEHQRSELFGR